MTTSTKDFYATLEVPRSATVAEIKKAYKRQALQFHPDKNPEDQRAVCEAKFKLIARAYEVLGNEETRKRYDAGGMKAVDAAAAASSAPSSRQSDAASTASSRRPEPARRERSEWQTGWEDYRADSTDRSPWQEAYSGAAGAGHRRADRFHTSRDGEMPQSPFVGSPFHAFAFTDPFELFDMIFAASPLTPGFGSPFVAGRARPRSFVTDQEPSSPWQQQQQRQQQQQQQQYSGQAQRSAMAAERSTALAPLGAMGGMGLFGMGGFAGVFGHMNAMMDAMMMGGLEGVGAHAGRGYFGEDFASVRGAGAQSFSSHTVISNGRAKTVTVKRYTDRDGQVHEERTETEGDAFRGGGGQSVRPRAAVADDKLSNAATRNVSGSQRVPTVGYQQSETDSSLGHRYASRPEDAVPRPSGYGRSRYDRY
jgi:curved DNA-binding protein CbpA